MVPLVEFGVRHSTAVTPLVDIHVEFLSVGIHGMGRVLARCGRGELKVLRSKDVVRMVMLNLDC